MMTQVRMAKLFFKFVKRKTPKKVIILDILQSTTAFFIVKYLIKNKLHCEYLTINPLPKTKKTTIQFILNGVGNRGVKAFFLRVKKIFYLRLFRVPFLIYSYGENSAPYLCQDLSIMSKYKEKDHGNLNLPVDILKKPVKDIIYISSAESILTVSELQQLKQLLLIISQNSIGIPCYIKNKPGQQVNLSENIINNWDIISSNINSQEIDFSSSLLITISSSGAYDCKCSSIISLAGFFKIKKGNNSNIYNTTCPYDYTCAYIESKMIASKVYIPNSTNELLNILAKALN
jgi:hypothetical protein